MTLPSDGFRGLLQHLLDGDVEDKAMVDAAAILAAGHGVRFIVTIQNGHNVDVRAERLDYDAKGKVR